VGMGPCAEGIARQGAGASPPRPAFSDGGHPLHRSMARRAALAVVGLLALAPAAQAATSSSRTTLTNSTPDWATPNAQVGSVPDSAQHTFWVYLSMRNSKALDAAIAAATNPASAGYGKYLTPDQFRARYAPTDADVAAVRAYLKQSGFTVSADRPDNNRWVKASGTTAQVEQAFKTQLRTYQHRGKTLEAPNGDLSIARSIATRIAGIAGLDGSDRLMKPDIADAPPSPAFVNAPPCSASWGEKTAVGDTSPDGQTIPSAYGDDLIPYATCGYTPNQLQGAYGTKAAVAGGLDGHGQTVAIVDAFASPTILQDANQYATTHGQPAVDFSQITPEDRSNDPIGGPDECDAQGWYGEETLDVEAVHAMAPGAHELFVGGADCLDESLIDAVNKIVDGGLAQIVSNSYGNLGETGEEAGLRQAWNDTFRQAALEGIGMYFSSGDSGDETDNLGHAEADFPASHPLVTAVGGTSLGVSGSDGYLFETGWGTTTTTLTDGAWDPAPPGAHVYGSGGGTSLFYAEPDYQKPVVPKKLAKANGGKPARVVPDVSLVGDPQTGMLVGQTQTFPDGTTKYSEYRLGGTSLSSPLMAGVMALADQQAGRHHGFANPALYAQYGTSAYRDTVAPDQPIAVVRNDYVNSVDASDGTTTKLRTFDQTESLHTTPGYDDVTGVGSPNGQRFLAALAAAAAR
jgi:subtilase family serine protease